MADIYEAIVQTDDGATFRAFQMSPSTVCITEDGVDGIIDYIELPADFHAMLGPELALAALESYIYEMRRGLSIVSAKLRRRGGT